MDDKKDIKDSYKRHLSLDQPDPYALLAVNRNKELFLLKKTEKFVSAVYLLTDLFEKDSLFRTRLREISFGLLSDSCLLALGADHPESVRSFQGHALELLTVLKSAYFAGAISEMNFSVFMQEYSRFIALFDEAVRTGGSQMEIGAGFFDGLPERETAQSIGHFKGHSFPAYKDIGSDRSKKRTSFPGTERRIGKNGASRSAAILSLIKKQGSVSVRDMAVIIREVSEKTLQRDLLSLVASGVLRKSGERRWSRYSLAGS